MNNSRRTNIPLRTGSVNRVKKKFEPEARRTSIATQETFLDDIFKPRVHKDDRPAEVDRMLDLFASIEPRDYYIIGYGSLMNERSRKASYTSLEDFPAMVKGWQRVFNIGSQLRKATVLNVFEKPDTEMPVVITKVSHRSMFNLIMREWQYDLVEIDPSVITDMNGTPIEFESKPIMVVGREERAVSEYSPMQNYCQTCTFGCANYSLEMATAFGNSTFLADKETTLLDWAGNIFYNEWCKNDSNY